MDVLFFYLFKNCLYKYYDKLRYIKGVFSMREWGIVFVPLPF